MPYNMTEISQTTNNLSAVNNMTVASELIARNLDKQSNPQSHKQQIIFPPLKTTVEFYA
jgi:hypothetical protein